MLHAPRLSGLMLAALVTLGASVLPGAAIPDEPIGAGEFEAYTEGRTLYYGRDGEPYGVEEYLPGRRVKWSFLDGECIDGEWYAEGRAICFVYEERIAPICWEFFLEGDGLSARILGRGDESRLYEIAEADEPMQCLGPRIGV